MSRCRIVFHVKQLLLIAFVLLFTSLSSVYASSLYGSVNNTSQWRNDETLVPPDWHVAPTTELVPGHGRVVVSLFFLYDVLDNNYLSPIRSTTVVPSTTNTVDLATISGGNWFYNFSLLDPGNYRVLAFIDGNLNGFFESGEPFGFYDISLQPNASFEGVIVIKDDFDGDGMEEWWEAHWFDSTDQTAEMDYDNDGLTNLDEYNLINALHPDYMGTNVFVEPNNWDSDGDGMDDGWEFFYGLDLVDATGIHGADGDYDNDGVYNLEAYLGPDGVGWRLDENGDGIAENSTSTDAMDPTQVDSDHDGVPDADEIFWNLTHPVHSMSGTNFAPRSLSLNVDSGNGTQLTDPTSTLFAFDKAGGTVEFWVYPESDGDGIFYAFPQGLATSESHFRISLEAFRPRIDLMRGNSILATAGGAGGIQQLETNQWTHVAFVIAPANKTLSIYLNGVLLIAQKVFVTPDFKLGKPTICEGFSDGYLDELRVWNYPRGKSDVEYWSTRIYPAPGYVQQTINKRNGESAAVYAYTDPFPLLANLRFDDGGDAIENFAFVNHGMYPFRQSYRLTGVVTNAVTTDQFVSLSGSDDADGDNIPEWWGELHNLIKYQEYYTSQYGPRAVFTLDGNKDIVGFEYYRSFVGYASVGNNTGWQEGDEGTFFYEPKTSPDFYEGNNSSYTRYQYLFVSPRTAPLKVYTPGMISTVIYVNGVRVTTSGDESNTSQAYDVAPYMTRGRNKIHIECKSDIREAIYSYSQFGAIDEIEGVPYNNSDYFSYDPRLRSLAPLDGADGYPYRFRVAIGKFDAQLDVNGVPTIVRGDQTRGDPRAVWHVQLWSDLYSQIRAVPLPDREMRSARNNPDYGVMLHAERDNNPFDPDNADDGLDAIYEFICDTNPRERDSDNDGISDGDEDYDADGLINREEQRFGASVWLPDSDDDGLYDGLDVGDGHPAQSLSPQRNQSLRFGGGVDDCVSLPLQQRFALEKWSIEMWIKPDIGESDGVLIQRDVGGGSINYEVGLNASKPYVRYVSVAGVEVMAMGTNVVVADGSTWTHVAATYYDRQLNLYIDGTNVALQVGASFPALYAGGPIVQRIGSGFEGCIDEFRLWSAERSAEQIVANIGEVLTGLEDDLVAYYRFDDGTSYESGSPLVGTSANNGTNGVLPAAAWEWGQVEDYVLRYGTDWWVQWKHAASFAGDVTFSTNHVMQGPPRLQVFIENSDAREAGARWSHNGASWNESGFVETYLSAGDYDISFNSIEGWFSPSRLPVTLVRGQSTVVTGVYVKTASLTVNIENFAMIKDIANWSIDGGANWYGSGVTVDNLEPSGEGYSIIFSDVSEDVSGWEPPRTLHVQFLPGESRLERVSYTRIKGSLQVSFTPDDAPSAARWKVEGTTNWLASGETATNLTYGEHRLEYNAVEWWQEPEGETIQIERSAPVYTLERAWVKLPEPSFITVAVTNNSVWLNDSSIVPPHWPVGMTNGTVVSGEGQVKLAAFPISNLDTAVNTESVYPETTGTSVDLATILGMRWEYLLRAPEEDGTYRLVAWIDANGNDRHDAGEPQGYSTTTIVGGSALSAVNITIVDDSDLDGMADWWEVHWFGDVETAPAMDDDNDGLDNLREFELTYNSGVNLNPVHWDTDGDGMDDAWEVFYGLDPTSAAAVDGTTGDPDGDGVNNITEYVSSDGIGWRRDVNGDGIAEFTRSTDAMSPTDTDSDWDGVSDGSELVTDLTHPVHAMNSTNFVPRSLRMDLNGGAGEVITDPTGSAFALGHEGGTFECWVYPQTDGTGILYSSPTAEAAGLDSFRVSLDDFRPKLEVLSGASVKATVGGVGAAGSIQQLEPDQWSHLAFVMAPDNNSLSIYLNGVLLIAQKVFVNLNYAGTPTICSGFTDGYIDELRVWNYPRPVADIEHWSRRYYPAPDYVQLTATRRSGTEVDMYAYQDPFPLRLYLRFDDGGDEVENFAYLNHGLYPNADSYRIGGAMPASVTTAQAVPMYGSDDSDGDMLPEWWVDLHDMEKYLSYDTSAYGPYPVWCPEKPGMILGFKYYRSFTAYASVGNQVGWLEDGNDLFYAPKTNPDFYEGVHSSYTKHVYIFSQPRSCPLNIYTPGMTSTVVYVNGTRVTTTGDEGNDVQAYDVAQYMKIGRNTVHVECESTTYRTADISGLPYDTDEYRAYADLPSLLLGCDEKPYRFTVALGKFDAELSCNGVPVIVRGDKTRADSRAVWHVQLWSSLFEAESAVPLPDLEFRDAKSSSNYGVPLHAERANNPLDPDSADDGLDAIYEYICGTNPRERDSNNNGIPDGDEDFDSDNLVNLEEQRLGSSPWLPDSDDDGFYDGVDVGDGHPAQSLSPQRNQSLRFGGGAADYISTPIQQRFALDKWTIEAWVQPDADEVDGGILTQRSVGGGAVNYEIGLNVSNQPYVRYVSVGGVEVLATAADPVVADGSTWTHVAASYYNRTLNLFINGTNVISETGGSFPALYAGGPVQQRIGAGFKGCIDEWRLWNAALDGDRILANIDEVLTGLEDDLVAYYRFDDDTSYDPGLPVIGTSANNGTNGVLPATAWQWGQVEDNVLRYSLDWWLQWKHAASFSGSVSFSTNFIMQGPPRLQVFLENDDAVTAGARWSYNGGASWNESGFIETSLPAGDYNISFQSIDGWIAPSTLPLTLVRGQSTIVTGIYAQSAALTVIVEHDSSIKEVATWSIDGGVNWYGSGVQVANLVPGGLGYDIIFSDISGQVPGWNRPSSINVVLNEGESRTVSAEYTAVAGALQITFSSTNTPSAARWRVSGNSNWWSSGETVTNLAYGEHQIEYNEVAWWQAPADETIVIERSAPAYLLSREWVKLPEPSMITVTISPAMAVSEGAQWSVNGNWHNSGDSVAVEAGSHVVTYRTLSGWLEPADITVDAINVAASTTGTYYRVDIVGNADDDGFAAPWGVAATPRHIYVSDSANSRVRVYDRVSKNWSVIGSAGSGVGQFRQPMGIALAGNGDLWVTDTGNHRIQRLSMATGNWRAFGSYGGNVGQFVAPYDLAVDAEGNVFVADYHNSRIQKRFADGNWSVVIDGGAQPGRVRYPSGLALDAAGNLYVSDYDPTSEGFDGRIQKFSNAGNFVEPVAVGSGNGVALDQNMGMSVALDGSLLVANTFADEVIMLGTNDNWSTVIRDGVVLKPRDVAVDSWGNTIISDSGNNRILILSADDSDGDGVSDVAEATFGTLVGTADSDGDGVDDGIELRLGYDPLDALDVPVVRYPSDNIVVTDRTPTFVWPDIVGSTWYRVWLNRNGATYLTPWVSGMNAWTSPALPGGDYTWWVQGWGAGTGFSGWSDAAEFSVTVSAPGNVVQIGPVGAQTENNLTYSWQKDNDATWYRLYSVRDGVGPWRDEWHGLSGAGVATVDVDAHPQGSFSWWVRPWGPDGYGPWSGPMAFSTPDPSPAKAVLVAPIGVAAVNPPALEWTGERADWYRVYVSLGGVNVIDEWTTGETLTPPAALASGLYTWYVGGWNSITREVIWSDPFIFTVP